MLQIYKITENETVDFAASELKKYLLMMFPDGADAKISSSRESLDGFRLGLMQDFGLDTSDVENTALDDIIYIKTEGKCGIIAGSNPRSVLMAVYEYLKKQGCAWYFPGVDGEFIPASYVKDYSTLKNVDYRFVPTTRHRAHSSLTSDMDYIDFLPKIGMNSYMIEFKFPRPQFSTYTHKYNRENRNPEPISDDLVMQWKRMSENEVRKRGLDLHGIGHGFTLEPFCPGGTSAGLTNENLPENIRQYVAQLDGERRLNNSDDLPFGTNFCMSNGAARKIVVDNIVDCASDHPYINYLHVWLADGMNNHCECEACRKKTPSDWYMVLLNELDEALSEKRLDTKIVFISYVDTTWAPKEEKIKNPERFSLLFAPISRSYSETLPNPLPEFKTEPYVLNKSKNPETLYAALCYLNEWDRAYKGDKIAFEYHFWRHKAYDITGLQIAKRIYEDVRAFEDFGVNGIIQCAAYRPYFPNAFAYYVNAMTLYNKNLSFEEIREYYFSGIYGEDWRKIYNIFEKMCELMPFDYVSLSSASRRAEGYISKEYAEKILKMKPVIEEEGEFIASHYNSDRRVRTVAVRLLELHKKYVTYLSDIFYNKAIGENEKALEIFNEARIELGKIESIYSKYFPHQALFSAIKGCAQVVTRDTVFAV